MFDRLRQWFLSALEQWARPRPDPIPIPEPMPTPRPVPNPMPLSPSEQVVAAINAARATARLSPLLDDRVLGEMATSWAASMASFKRLSHGDFSGRLTARFPHRSGAENIAEGQPNPIVVVDAWMNSPPHRANILGRFNRVGAGSARDSGGTLYWCADFVRVD